MLTPENGQIGRDVGNDARILPVRIEAWVGHPPSGADEGLTHLVDDAELQIGARAWDKWQDRQQIDSDCQAGCYSQHDRGDA